VLHGELSLRFSVGKKPCQVVRGAAAGCWWSGCASTQTGVLAHLQRRTVSAVATPGASNNARAHQNAQPILYLMNMQLHCNATSATCVRSRSAPYGSCSRDNLVLATVRVMLLLSDTNKSSCIQQTLVCACGGNTAMKCNMA
jgi:hypothetical protein